MKREVIYAENGLKLFFYSESGVSAAEEARSFLARHFDHFSLGPRFFELQFADDTSLGIPFETAQGEARAIEMAIAGEPVHGNKGWLLVTDGKFGDEGKPIYECRWGDRLLYDENGISLHVNDENSIIRHAPPGLAWWIAFTWWITFVWQRFIWQRFIRLRKRLRTRRFRQRGPEFILTIGRWFVGISSATAAALAAAIISKRTDDKARAGLT